MTAVVFTDGEIASAAKFNEIANAADNALTAANGMADSASQAAAAAQAAQASQGVAAAYATSAQASATTAASQTAAAMANVGRNYLHNSTFRVLQRGLGPWTANGYTADRWWCDMFHSTGSAQVSVVSLADADRAAIGDESATWSLQFTYNGGTGAADYDALYQRIESARRCGGKTLTVSFWAKAQTGAPQVGVSCDQFFGSGGSPSPPTSGNGKAVTIGATWARYSVTVQVPSTSGKTLGTNNDDTTEFPIWLSSGANNAARAGNIGVISNTVWFWGMQVEIGSVATPLAQMDYALDDTQCKRFFYVGRIWMGGLVNAGVMLSASHPQTVPMRGFPSMTLLQNNSSGILGPVQLGSTDKMFYAQAPGTGTGGALVDVTFSASADL